MSTTIEVRKANFYGMCGVIGVLAIALLVFVIGSSKPIPPPASDDGGLISDRKDVPVSPELRSYLEAERYSLFLLVNHEGRVKVVNRLGKEVAPCGSLTRTMVPEDCGTDATSTTNLNDVEIAITRGSPLCTKMRVQGKLIKVHADGPYAGFPPCHEGGSSDHD